MPSYALPDSARPTLGRRRMTQYSAHSLTTGSDMSDDSDGYPLVTAGSVRQTLAKPLPVQAKGFCGTIDEETLLSHPVRGT